MINKIDYGLPPDDTVVKNLLANARVQSLVREDSTYHEATKPTSHKYQAHVLQISELVCL